MRFSEMPYERIDFEALKKEFSLLMKRFSDAASGEEQFALHRQYYRLTDHVMTEMTIAMIRNDIDMSNEFYSEEQRHYDKNMPVFRNLVVEYQKLLYASRFRSYLEEKIGKPAFRNIELAMQGMDEKLIPLMQEENELSTAYNKLLASARLDWNGESLNLSLMTPYLHHRDRAVRKRAWECYSSFFTENQEALDDFYERLVKNRTKQGELMGHKNFLPLGYARMNRNCYTASDLAMFRKEVREALVPFSERLHEKRRKRLKLSSLSYIDEGCYFPNGNPSMIGTPEQILAAGQKMYQELSPETAAFINTMQENELFDVLGRKTKKTGGYMTMLPDYQLPFIFANFNGSSGDADVITHECGHAFQGFLTAKAEIHEHNDLSMETAETHSMAMEFFTEPWMPLFFGERAAEYIEMHFEEAVNFIPYGTMVDEFQHIVYEDPGLGPRGRKQVWRDLERQYKPHLSYEGNRYFEEGGFWQKQHHIYDSPLYYIDYCIAGINALQYKVWMEKDFGSAWQSYLGLCRLSASDFFNVLVEKAGLRNPFSEGCIRSLMEQLEGVQR